MPNPSAKIIIRYYVNGTIARFLGYYFDSYIVAPQSLASDMSQTNFTDGSFVQFFEVSGRKVYYPPPRPAAEPTYFKAQAILSIESNAYALSRIVYRNGTIATRNDSNGAIIGFEVPPTSWQPSFEIKLISACQWEEIDYIKDVRNMFYCLPNSTWTAFQRATFPRVNMTLKDGNRRIAYLNGTIALLAKNNSFIRFEVPPKSYYIEFPRVQ